MPFGLDSCDVTSDLVDLRTRNDGATFDFGMLPMRMWTHTSRQRHSLI